MRQRRRVRRHLVQPGDQAKRLQCLQPRPALGLRNDFPFRHADFPYFSCSARHWRFAPVLGARWYEAPYTGQRASCSYRTEILCFFVTSPQRAWSTQKIEGRLRDAFRKGKAEPRSEPSSGAISAPSMKDERATGLPHAVQGCMELNPESLSARPTRVPPRPAWMGRVRDSRYDREHFEDAASGRHAGKTGCHIGIPNTPRPPNSF